MESHRKLGPARRTTPVIFCVLCALCEKLPAQDPDLARGLALAQENRYDEAEAAFREGLRKNPNDARFATELAGVAYRKKNNDEAKTWLTKALRQDPQDAYSNDFLATLFLLDHNLPAALK